MFVEFRKINRQQSIRGVQILTIGGFLFFFGLRGFVSTDWYNYYPFFEKIGTLWNGNLLSMPTGYNKEIGFIVYSVIIKSICPNYFFWIFVSTAIDIALLHVIFKRHAKYYVLAFIVFFVMNGEVIEFNLMRNIKSILLFILSLKYLQERRIMPYMLLNVLGMSFHISAIVYIPMYFLLHRKFPKILLWLVFIVGNMIFLLQIEYIHPILLSIGDLLEGQVAAGISYYLATDMYNHPYGFTIGYFERVLAYMLVMLCYNRLLKQDHFNVVFINAHVLYFFFFFFFAELTVMTQRLPLLFVFSYWILYPNLFALIKIETNKLIIVLVAVLFFSLKVAVGNTNLFTKYDNLLFGIKDYEEKKATFSKYREKILKNE
jgi:hypothetical protein